MFKFATVVGLRVNKFSIYDMIRVGLLSAVMQHYSSDL